MVEAVPSTDSLATSNNSSWLRRNSANRRPKQDVEGEEIEVPLELNPFASSQSSVNYDMHKAPTFQRQERELFEMAIILEGPVQKATKGFLSRYQKKYFKVISNGAYLAYYDQQPDRRKATVPNGVFFIHKITNISKGKNSENKFNFMYNDRLFEFQVSKPVEVQIWVLCLQFLHDHSLECIS